MSVDDFVDDFVDVGEIRGRGGGRKHSADTLKLQKWHIFMSIPTIVCDAFGLMARRICAHLIREGKRRTLTIELR
ncbi:MAG: hypothetical protein HY791_40015 [Deltaproteobacteria bacterium]|nr:hypothetical protein [Deltaproteobacteria bacterium]